MPDWLTALIAFISAALASLGASFALIRVAGHIGLMDAPGGRKDHALPTPVVGGAAIAGVLVLTLGAALSTGSTWLLCLLVSIVIIAAVGILDDAFELAPLPKFAGQAIACLIMIFVAGVELRTVGELLGWRAIGMWFLAVPATIFAVIGVINAINMADGIDGHASGVGVIALGTYAVVAALSDLHLQSAVLIICAGASLGFWFLNARLPWNQRARAFLGDAGSMLLGFLLGWFAVDLTAGNGSSTNVVKTFPPICALWVIVIPLCDCVSLMLRRRSAGRSMFVADREHLHHYLLLRGLSVGQSSAVLLGANLACAVVGLAGWLLRIPQWLLFAGFVIFFVSYHRAMRRQFSPAAQARSS